MRRSRRVLFLAALALAGLSAWLWTAPAKAVSPVKDGWWTVTNTGVGFTPPSPQVPSNGLYVQNGFAGPVAISALTFAVDPGSAIGPISLKISGNPVITSPPLACPLTAAGRNYKPEQAGAWSDAPAYDCTKSQVTGKVSSDNTTVTFDSGPLLDNGTVAVAIIAGGNADQIAFNPPGSDALSVTPPAGSDASGAGGGAASVGSPSGVPAGTPVGINDNSGISTGSAINGVPSAPVAGVSPALAPGLPSAASPQSGPTAAKPAAVSPLRRAGAGKSGSGVRKDLAQAIGIAALLAALVAYSEGFGLLGGRIILKSGVDGEDGAFRGRLAGSTGAE